MLQTCSIGLMCESGAAHVGASSAGDLAVAAVIVPVAKDHVVVLGRACAEGSLPCNIWGIGAAHTPRAHFGKRVKRWPV